MEAPSGVPKAQPPCLHPNPREYIGLSWGHTYFYQVSPFRGRVLWAGLLYPDPMAFLSDELARESNDTPDTGVSGPPPASSHPRLTSD